MILTIWRHHPLFHSAQSISWKVLLSMTYLPFAVELDAPSVDTRNYYCVKPVNSILHTLHADMLFKDV